MRFRVENQELFYLGVVKKVRVWDYPKNENREFRWSAGALCFSGVGTHRICLLQGNPGYPTPFFESVSTLAVLAILSNRILLRLIAPL